MRFYDIIEKKKQGHKLTPEEILFAVKSYTDGEIPDYQMSAFLMAVYFRSMDEEEICALTEAIETSGDTLDLSAFGDTTVDKHSTGGVGDKTTLIVAPIAAACGATVAKMSGRGLGHTGGTVDKLESIEGYRTLLTPEEFTRQVEEIGISVIAQSGNLAPADKKLYALRDVTATVDSIPLIASSIMGKKLATSTRSLVLDVKCGDGAFMKSREDARALARLMVAIGNMRGRRTVALITNMEEPLGYCVGNALEVREAIAVLRGEGPSDLTELSLSLAALMVSLALGISENEAKNLTRDALFSGLAYKKLGQWISRQGGDFPSAESPDFALGAKIQKKVAALKGGYVSACRAEAVGNAAMILGAGRAKKEDIIDMEAGIVLLKKCGDKVTKGEPLAILYTNSEDSIPAAEKLILSAYSFSRDAPERLPLIIDTVRFE